MKLKDATWSLERLAIEAGGDIIGKFSEHIVAPFIMTTIRYEFIWRHPDASRDAIETRMCQEEVILIAKIERMGAIPIRRAIPRKKYQYDYWGRRAFAHYIEALMRRMIVHGATAEEVAAIAEMSHEYGCGHKDTISINNLKWIHKMENKYGVEGDDE